MPIIVRIKFFKRIKLWLPHHTQNCRKRLLNFENQNYTVPTIKRKYYIVRITRAIKYIQLKNYKIIDHLWYRPYTLRHLKQTIKELIMSRVTYFKKIKLHQKNQYSHQKTSWIMFLLLGQHQISKINSILMLFIIQGGSKA